MIEKDAVIVGARCAGSTLAIALAKHGLDVLMVDPATFPSDTVSTHIIFPNTVARFEQLGVLERLNAKHDVPTLGFRIAAFGEDLRGHFTPIDGFDGVICPRRIALDAAFVETAEAAGAETRFGTRVTELLGTGTTDDPVTGVVLDDGEQVRAKWVLGADGRASTVAAHLGVEKTRENRGGVSFLFAYWQGIPNDGWATSSVSEIETVSSWAGEDGTHLLVAWGDPEFTRGSHEERMRRYLEMLHRHPEVVSAEALEQGEIISDLVVAPETLMRGYFRKPTGPGWALVGDACHFKHPATGQGIGDAVEQALHVADAIAGGDPDLSGYEAWRDGRAAEHYDWSYSWGHFPRPESAALFKGWATEEDARQDLFDTFSRCVEPSGVLTKERLGRWFATT